MQSAIEVRLHELDVAQQTGPHLRVRSTHTRIGISTSSAATMALTVASREMAGNR